MRLRLGRRLWILSLMAALGLVAQACSQGGDGGGGGGGAEGVTIVQGTTDVVISLDPATSYDYGSWTLVGSLHDALLEIPPGETQPQPALAEECSYENPKTYTCTLKDGIKFSDGSDLTSEDVKFSIERVVNIADEQGPSSLFANLKSIDTPDEATVTFNLKEPDGIWPFVLSTEGAVIVPSDVYPADKAQPDGEAVGAGPYTLEQYRPGEQAVLKANPNYWGEPPANETAIVQYFDKSSALKLALEQGEIDIAYRSLSPVEIQDLQQTEGIEVIEGQGTEIRYLVVNLKLDPGSELAVRKALAYSIDRQAIVDNVYNGIVDPLYSMVPAGLPGAVDAFAQEYGEASDPAAAERVLQQAGVQTPVDVEIWWTPSHYGDASADEYAEIERMLEETDLFDVTLKSTEWDQYSSAAFTDSYPFYQLGWFPDFPDADNYLTPFYGSETSFLNNHYKNPTVDKLLAKQRSLTELEPRTKLFEQIQRITAQDVPIIPVWQGGQVAAAQEGVTGIEETFDPTFNFRYSLLSKEE